MTRAATILEPDTCEGTLSIAGTSLFLPSWWITDMSAINDWPDLRGADIPIPGDVGSEAQAREIAATVLSFPMVIAGDRQPNGTAHADPAVGVLTNLETLYAAIGAMPGTTAGTRTAVWTWPDGVTTRSANVHVLPLKKVRRPGHWYRGILTLSIPLGRFA